MTVDSYASANGVVFDTNQIVGSAWAKWSTRLAQIWGLHSCMFIAENCFYCMHTDWGIYRKAAKEAKSESRWCCCCRGSSLMEMDEFAHGRHGHSCTLLIPTESTVRPQSSPFPIFLNHWCHGFRTRRLHTWLWRAGFHSRDDSHGSLRLGQLFFWKHLEQIRRTMLKICCFHVVSNIYKAALWWVYSRGEFWDVVKHNSFSMMEGMITPMCLADIFHMFFRVHLSARWDFRNQLPCLMRCRCSDFRCFWITWRHCCHYHRRENGSETRSSQKSISDSFCLWECFLNKMLIHVWSHQHYILSTYIYVCQ